MKLKINIWILLILVININVYGLDTVTNEQGKLPDSMAVFILIVNSLVIYIIAKRLNRRVWLHILIGIPVSIVWPVIMLFLGKVKKNIMCTWCNSHRMEFLEGTEGKWYWKYRNKNGSKDKRVKDNYEMASYTSIWQCKECNAKSKFKHFVDKKPSRSVNVWKSELLEEGEGERIGMDFEDEDASFVKTNEEN